MTIANDSTRATLYNAAFIQNLKAEGGLEKTASAMTDFVRIKIREASFTRKILPPKMVTSADLDRSLESDTPVRYIDKDQVSQAYPVTFREQTQQRYYKGTRFPVYYSDIQSQEFTKVTQELMTYKVPIKQIVQENYLKDIQIAEDKSFIDTVDALIAARETASTGSAQVTIAATNGVQAKFSPEVLAEGIKLMVNKQIPMGTVLISEADFLSLLQMDMMAAGSQVLEDVIVNGFSYTKLMGYTFIRTLKNDIVKPGNIYLFTTPEYLGVFDVLEDVKAFIEQKANKIRFYLYETIGIAIGNDNGLVKIVLAKA